MARAPYYPPAAVAAYAGAASQQQDMASQQQLQDLLQFNAPRHFIRASVGRLPNSSSLRHKCHLPLGVVVQPLAPPAVGQADVPSVSFGGGAVVRCKRCRTYINPFVVWESSGRRWICNLCGVSNETPQFYCRATDEKGRREDRFERPELCMGSIEIIAPSDYMIRPPQPPAFLFLIDVSLPSVASGLVESACQGIADAIRKDRLPGDSRTMVGIVTYDSSAHFYALKTQQTRPQVFVVPQVDDMFLPLSEDLLVPLLECKEAVLSTLAALPDIWRSTGCTENCMVGGEARELREKGGSALKAATMVAKHVGGKILLFSAAPPTMGEAVVKREPNRDKGNSTTDRETDLLKPASDAYQNLGQQLTQSQLSVDMFLCPPAPSASSPTEAVYYPPPPASQSGMPTSQQQNQPMSGGLSGAGNVGRGSHLNGSVPASGVSFYDVASFATLAQFTSGELRFYPSFTRQQHGPKLMAEIERVLSRVTGWEAVMRIRVSRGWKVSQRHGRFYLRGSDLFVLPTVNEDQSFSVSLELDETATPGATDNILSLQAALLYTNSDGERRIRVHTYCIPLTQNMQEIAASMDPEATAALMLQHSMDLSLRAKVADGRSYLQNLCVQLMSALQLPAAGHSAYGAQPSLQNNGEQLRRLAFLIMGMLKSPAFRSTKDVTNDMRVYAWHRLASVPLSQLVAYWCPRLFSLTDWGPTEGSLDGNAEVILPPSIPLTSESMTQEGAYLIENGESMLLWVGKSVPSEWLLAVFGVSALEFLHPEAAASSLGRTNDSLGQRTYAMISELQRQRLKPDYMELTIIRQGDSNEQLFFAMLAEDRVQSLPLTFTEFLQKVGQRQLAPVTPMPPAQRGY
ncbi:transport protein [Cyclospora cayetanensis]|uniref:Transport protein n=1 Tax=Cyclospora cayetanensis TaxID=88456 RepID=A0A1D3D593_9EIME|nr:transport protein [Cyclospora cayetanensis]